MRCFLVSAISLGRRNIEVGRIAVNGYFARNCYVGIRGVRVIRYHNNLHVPGIDKLIRPFIGPAVFYTGKRTIRVKLNYG